MTFLTRASRGYLTVVMEKLKPAGKPVPGRPRTFDRDQALDVAMRLFWRHGFEGVSFKQLTSELGIAAPSLYAAFGNKEALFREALDLYVARREGADLAFMDQCASLEDAVRELLCGTARGLVEPGGEIGCMLNTGMLAAHPDHLDLIREVAARRRTFEALLGEKLRRWLDAEQARTTATFVYALMQGMAVHARDGAKEADLVAIAHQGSRALY